MLAETLTGGYAVVINDQQIGKALFLRVAVAGKGKGMKGFQPAMISCATIGSFAKSQHDSFSIRLSTLHIQQSIK
ncbi:hypothetical protein APX70_03131 [Pseudomonas syringae pv. maculicola]|uniref:Uncharacterized protein n=1 Tax=Pseudomonas syringae pv. maculicola TaxID=59511 RepID=A0A3M2X2Y1_PSEYM|nr:hypothetical protein APX70_03131 [Pseudomonas syringae pv. maculicola]